MKRNLLWLFLGAIILAGIGAAVDNSTRNLYIQNSDPTTVKIRVRTAAAQTAPWLEFVETNATRFSLPATGIIPNVYLNIRAGTNIISGNSTVTNTFSTAFSAAPFVTITRFTAGAVTNTVLVSVSTTNFIAWGQTNSPFHWQAIGTP
jgi:hypothetical protein